MHSARRVVVTGGAGFIGSHLCETLLQAGDEVVCLDNFLTGTPSNVGPLLDHPRFTLQHCDLVHYVHVPGSVDLVLHFASPARSGQEHGQPPQRRWRGARGLHAVGAVARVASG